MLDPTNHLITLYNPSYLSYTYGESFTNLNNCFWTASTSGSGYTSGSNSYPGYDAGTIVYNKDVSSSVIN